MLSRSQIGLACGVLPGRGMTHHGGQSLKPGEDGCDKMRVEMYRTRLAYFRKHHGRAAAWALRAIYACTLPWNIAMLTQSVLRGTISRGQFDQSLQTLRAIARLHVPASAGVA